MEHCNLEYLIFSNFKGSMLKVMKPLCALCIALLLAALTVPSKSAAQQILATVPVGEYGQALAVNPVTGKLYVVSEPGNELTEIDLKTFKISVIPLGTTSEKSLDGAIRIDTARNRIFVTNVVNSTVAVIDGVTHAVTFVPVGKHPTTMEFNRKTNKLYVANSDSDDVTVVDGRTLKTKTIPVGSFPSCVAINTHTNTIYVTNSHGNSVSVIRGRTNSVRTITVGQYPVPVAVNRKTNRIYVGNLGGDTVTVIDGRSLQTETVRVSPYPFWIVVNEKTNKVYMNHQVLEAITVLDGRTNAVATIGKGIIARGSPNGLVVDELRNRIYVGEWTTRVTMIDGRTNTTYAISNPEYNTHKIIANPRANQFYTLNMTTNIYNKIPPSSVGIFAGPK